MHFQDEMTRPGPEQRLRRREYVQCRGCHPPRAQLPHRRGQYLLGRAPLRQGRRHIRLDLDSSRLPGVSHFAVGWADLPEVSVSLGRRRGYCGGTKQRDVTLKPGAGSTIAPQVIEALVLGGEIVGINASSLEALRNSRLASIELLPFCA
ncbi:hypothetical protein MAPG_03553 [Magnaporthiopsis poae ATCC 64411]|uniref:Uncharacterized protein n=1 Tax=Magnaporthiopsis poae (strain ATCC 64411 / 73-15) TaxID=644358 RepID=A0A0C4DUB5_MAGP6|nr:hypothetical protein MAPG_03553 [Magnaporthiopsis poae ATCC 64411]